VIIISRKKNEALVINDDIIVTVIQIRAGAVRLGIEHPAGVPVHKREDLDPSRQPAERPGQPK
jgi:carbon storage regulator